VQVGIELLMALVMRACDGGILNRPVHAFHLAIGPGMLDLGETVFNPVFLTAQVEQMGDVRGGRAVCVAWRKRKLDAIVRQHGVDVVGHPSDQRDQERGGCAPVCVAHELDEDEFAGAVDCHRQVQLAFRRTDLSDIDMNVADGVGLEWLLRWLVSSHVRQPADPVALQAPVQGRAGQVRDRGVQGVEAVIQGQQCLSTEGDNDGFFLTRECGGRGMRRAGGEIMDRCSSLPLRHCFGVDPVTFDQNNQAFSTLLDCSTHRRCRAGAPVKYLSHSASFH